MQARIGGNHPAETTGKWVAATFEHDSSRPVDGYAAPQLHTHVVFFNMTERAKLARCAPCNRDELYRSQQYATAIYRSELALRLRPQGYEIEQSAHGAPEIRGYTQEYLEASSPRRQQIKEHLTEEGMSGAEAAQIAAHRTREAKLNITHEEMQRRHEEMAKQYGNQPERIVREAQARVYEIAARNEEQTDGTAREAVRYSVEKNFEREAVSDERELMRDALKRAMGEAPVSRIQQQFDQAVENGGLIQKESLGIGRSFTTDEMIALERDNIRLMRSTQEQCPVLASDGTRGEIEHDYAHLSRSQHRAVQQVLSSRDQITALEGVAGAGKTTSLTAIRDAAEREGYSVGGFAPTSRAAHKLGEAGILSHTLQHHLARGAQADAGEKHLYVLDESSLASTRQINEFLQRLGEQDRVLLVGDVRQHEAVEAGRPYYQLQEAGMRTAHLDEIVRQKDRALKEAVEQLARGEVHAAVDNLDRQGRVQQIENREERFQTIAQDYARHPQGTLVVSPDNQSRRELNVIIHHELQGRGQVQSQEQTVRVLETRQELTGADRAWAEQYAPGDVLRYSRGSRVVGVNAGQYAKVADTDAKQNLLTVEREDGQHVSYDPRRLQGVSVYREAARDFAEGDRVQFTAPSKELHVASRELGTIARLDEGGEIAVRTDSGRLVEFQLREHPHLDYGYAVTSHSSQGQTADRVLIHADTEESLHLVNSRMAYVAVSRGRYDARIYTNDKSELAQHLSRDVSHSTAVHTGLEHGPDVGQKFSPSAVGHDTAQDHSVSLQSQGPSAGEGQGQAMGE